MGKLNIFTVLGLVCGILNLGFNVLADEQSRKEDIDKSVKAYMENNSSDN